MSFPGKFGHQWILPSSKNPETTKAYFRSYIIKARTLIHVQNWENGWYESHSSHQQREAVDRFSAVFLQTEDHRHICRYLKHRRQAEVDEHIPAQLTDVQTQAEITNTAHKPWQRREIHVMNRYTFRWLFTMKYPCLVIGVEGYV